MKRLFRGKRKLVSIPLLALGVPAIAVAAFILFTGVNGSGSGSFTAGSSTNSAITINGGSQPVLSGPGDTQTMAVTATNNDASNTHQLSSLAGAFTSSVGGCDSHLSVTGTSLTSQTISAGGSQSGSVSIRADAGTPNSCAGATWSVAFSGTTTP